jgi:hypothetical protein
VSSRKSNQGAIYLRRSGKRQETSLYTQLNWALAKASELNVDVDASTEDLDYMLSKGLSSFKSIRLDNGVSGSNPLRCGFLALNNDVLSNRAISHVFIYRRDRYARPEDAIEAVRSEKRLRSAGATLVYSTKTIAPGQRGERNLVSDLDSLLEFSEAGAFCDQLAERMILTHQSLAAKGFSTGGNPPMAMFERFFGPDGKFVQVLEKGRTVRQEGFHVRWIAGESEEDRSKIKIWILILTLCETGWGAKRIARYLNESAIPSPGAGTVRTDHGKKHHVSGKWSQTTVLDLIRNTLIVGEKRYGERSEGKHRRLDSGGWRYLDDSDLNAQDSPKTTKNPPQLVIAASSGGEAAISPIRHNDIQEKLKLRGHSQRGIPRARDPGKYPLSGSVFDLTDGCGSLMYGATQSGRPLYKCGRYMRSGGAECGNNAVDGGARLQHVLGSLFESARPLFAQNDLKTELVRLATQDLASANDGGLSELESTDQQLERLGQEVAVIGRNLARALDDEAYDQVHREFARVKNEIKQLEVKRSELLKTSHRINTLADVEGEVEKALSILKDIQRLAGHPEARLEIRNLLSQLGCRVGLSFVEAIKGKERVVRKLAGGIIVLGHGELPVPVHGKDALDGDPVMEHPHQVSSLPNKVKQTEEASAPVQRGSAAATSLTDVDCLLPCDSSQRDVSFTKVSRADWIRTSDLLTPSQTRYQTALRPE